MNHLKMVRVGKRLFYEYRPKRFVQVINGKAIARIEEEEIIKLVEKEYYGEIDPGIMELALALCAVTALLTTVSIPGYEIITLLIHLMAFVSFILCAYSAGVIYYSYLRQKFPSFAQHVSNPGEISGYYFDLYRGMRKSFSRQSKNAARYETEFAYITILGVITLLIFGVVIWMITSFAFDISLLS